MKYTNEKESILLHGPMVSEELQKTFNLSQNKGKLSLANYRYSCHKKDLTDEEASEFVKEYG